MEFDKTRVYTAVNAEELPIGSKCIFADTIHTLREKVESDSAQRSEYVLRAVRDGFEKERFEQDDGIIYLLAYLIEPPAEPKYKRFENFDSLIEAVKKHGATIKSKKKAKRKVNINGMTVDGYIIIDEILGLISYYSPAELLKCYVFADDDSPCGELVEQ